MISLFMTDSVGIHEFEFFPVTRSSQSFLFLRKKCTQLETEGGREHSIDVLQLAVQRNTGTEYIDLLLLDQAHRVPTGPSMAPLHGLTILSTSYMKHFSLLSTKNTKNTKNFIEN